MSNASAGSAPLQRCRIGAGLRSAQSRTLLEGGQTRVRSSRHTHNIARNGTTPRALLDGGTGGNGASPPGRQQQHSPPQPPQQQQHPSIQHPIFPESQPTATGSMPVPTQRGLPLFKPVLGDPPCPACSGTGKTTCGDCRGKGRLNYRGTAMLPQGVWPQWCASCRASGRWCCAKCMGTGVKRQPIGFRALPEEEEEGAS